MKNLPKIELHHHIEGAAPPSFIRDLAKRKSVDISKVFDESGGYAFTDFWHFLQVYEAATSVLQTPQDYHDLTLAVLQAGAEHGVIYTESFISPDFCGGGDVDAWRDYLAAIEAAANTATRDFGAQMRCIVTPVRHFGPDKARASALCAAETVGEFVVGLGMGGDEKAGKPADFAYAFDMAREAGLHLTAHAGEWGGPASVRAVIDDLRVERVGHGVRAIEDPALVDDLAERGIVLEVCPGSNVALGVYQTWADHPISKLMERGVKVTVSTDDPPFFHTTMTAEYENLARHQDWGGSEFATVNAVAVDAAFCDAETKDALRQKLEGAYD
ncbi:adenosine deaminase [Actibacterium mucosum KCTC 23349]|uniref:Adenosine deaminase n=1 Tax=Actibacterium mucosum KCTC 23349 TaxID=1454373 RepID=A0A037ZHV9_9RHOB|nr:adenosine deaminase [Actibacterium mucosum]KAJ55209.1 adenosine deaminase [Actibacterium mucosum KCTC 23349]